MTWNCGVEIVEEFYNKRWVIFLEIYELTNHQSGKA